METDSCPLTALRLPVSRPTPVAPPCPACGTTTARWLAFTSETNRTNTFHCVECTHVWTVDVAAQARESGFTRMTTLRPNDPLMHHVRLDK